MLDDKQDDARVCLLSSSWLLALDVRGYIILRRLPAPRQLACVKPCKSLWNGRPRLRKIEPSWIVLAT